MTGHPPIQRPGFFGVRVFLACDRSEAATVFSSRVERGNLEQMSDQDPKELEFVEAWYSTRFERYKCLLTLAGSGIGLLAGPETVVEFLKAVRIGEPEAQRGGRPRAGAGHRARRKNQRRPTRRVAPVRKTRPLSRARKGRPAAHSPGRRR
jgi:hypothetical protein